MCLTLASVLVAAVWIESVSTTATDPWFAPAEDAAVAPETEMTVDLAKTDQTMIGFGTAVSELSWGALSLLSAEDRAAVLDELFKPGVGAGFTYVRTPIGASDFAFDYYSYDDYPDDFAQEMFSLEIDERALLPLLREIKSRVPAGQFVLWGSPWCPPRWMKKSGMYASRPPYADDLPTNDCTWAGWYTYGEDAFTCDPRHYAAYAKYFRKYVDAMKAKGLPVSFVMPQNEPNSCQPYPSCTWRGRSLADFTVNYLGPALEGSGTEIYIGTIEERSTEKVHDIFEQPNGKKVVRGAGFQWEGRGSIGAIHRRYPDLTLVMSEHECNDGKNDWAGFLHSWDVARAFIGQGAQAYDYWNLALTDEQKSRWGWPQNSLVTVDRASRKARYNLEYFFMKQFAVHVKAGAKRLLTRGDLDELGFVNPDGSVVLMFANKEPRARAIAVTIGTERLVANLPADSLSTFVWSPVKAKVTVDFGSDMGSVKPVNGVGQPPNLGWINGRLFWHLTEAGVPFSRLHDVGGAYGGGRFVDIPNLFPDFDADENNPANYTFGYTDRLVAALVENGIEPCFRLGVSIENEAGTMGPVRIRPPKDFAKWARICEHVIRHYTEGWADGFRFKITRWEIWNEPENSPDPKTNPMWSAPFGDYLRFYGTVAPYLKGKFPQLEFGGYGSSGFYALTGGFVGAAQVSSARLEHFVTCFREFLAAAKANAWPLDFFSMHSYDMPEKAAQQIAFCRKTLDECGFTKTKISVNEWLPEPSFAKLGTARQAAEIAAGLAMLEESAADDAALYDAACAASMYAPLFNAYTHEPTRALNAFRAFKVLRDLGTRVKSAADRPGLYVTAARDDAGRGAVMLVNLGEPVALEFDFGGIAAANPPRTIGRDEFRVVTIE